MTNPSRAIRLYGTEEPVADERRLRAGRLDALFDGANLRDIRFNGEEVMRAVSFIVRDADWATWAPVISDLEISEADDRFAITYRATVGDKSGRFTYEARIEGTAEGVLSFSGRGEAPEGLLTNRTGFVVLHPIEGISGSKATIRHTDGRVVEGRFPDRIDPVQPMKDLRELSHKTPGGQNVSCLMEGNSYEMEDQRNWTDASYKTYVRPLALPWPYRIEPGEIIEQKITLTISGEAPAKPAEGPVAVSIGAASGRLPRIGTGLNPDHSAAVLDHAEQLSGLGASHLICYYDPRRGHDRDSLSAQISAARAIGAAPWLEAVIAEVDDEAAAREVAALGETVAGLGQPFEVVMVSPAPDLKCTLPGSEWPPAPDADRLYQATKAAFPGARIGGGMFSFFTELNRKRPPLINLDLVTFTTGAIFHAGDDRSMMETLECLPHIARTVPEITGSLPWSVGPSAIGMRDNPYGASALANPENIRQAVNYNDPRQRGIMGAAWTLGYLAAFAEGGAEAIALGEPVGPFGLLSVPAEFPQPWYEGEGGLYPVWHIMRGLARHSGQPIRPLTLSRQGALRGLAIETGDGTEIWLANPSPAEVGIRIECKQPARFSLLDADHFPEAARTPDFMDQLRPLEEMHHSLDAFAVMRIVSAG